MTRKTIFFLTPLFITSLVVVVVWIIFLFNLKRVFLVSSREIEGLTILNNKNILFLNENSISQSLLEKNHDVKTLTLRKKYPDTLEINVYFRTQFVKVVNFNSSVYLDSEGILLSEAEDFPGLPVIDIQNMVLTQNQKTDWRVLNALEFVKLGKIADISIERIIIDQNSSTFKMFLTSGTQVFVPLSSDPANIIASLQIIVSRFRIEGKFVSKIDFQFDKPIVILANGETLSSIKPKL